MSEFKNLKDKSHIFSEKLKNILPIFEITIGDPILNIKDIYTINKSRCNDVIEFPPHHSISRIDSDDA